MTDPPEDRDLQALWQSQPAHERISFDEIRLTAERLERRVARRNLREYVAAVIVVLVFGWAALTAPSAIFRIGAGLTVAAAVLVVYLLRRWGTARTLSSDLALTSALEFVRVQLERQRDVLRGVWWWAMLPFVPGLLLMQIGLALDQPRRLTSVIVWGVMMIVLMVALHALNRRAAGRIQQRIDRLKAHE